MAANDVVSAMAAQDDAAWASPEWLKAARDYGDPNVRPSDIAKSVGLETIALIGRMRLLGIKRGVAADRVTTSKMTNGATPLSPLANTPKPKPKRSVKSKKPARHKPIELVQRVYNTIDSELTKLEKQDGTTSQDRERASRALSQMVNSLEKAVEMQRDIVKDKTRGSGTKDKEALAHAEDLRRKIAERLEKLFVKRRAIDRAD